MGARSRIIRKWLLSNRDPNPKRISMAPSLGYDPRLRPEAQIMCNSPLKSISSTSITSFIHVSDWLAHEKANRPSACLQVLCHALNGSQWNQQKNPGKEINKRKDIDWDESDLPEQGQLVFCKTIICQLSTVTKSKDGIIGKSGSQDVKHDTWCL